MSATEQTQSSSAPGNRPLRILVVEDDPLIRRLLHRTLERRNYQVVTAASAREAHRAWSEQDEPFDLLVTDIVMPGQNGLDLARALHSSRPSLLVLLITGFAPAEIIGEDAQVEFPLLSKPFAGAELVGRIEELLTPRKTAAGLGQGF